MKVSSVSDLAFRALDELTDDEDKLWVAHIVFDGQAERTGDIQRIMKQDCGVSYSATQSILRDLVAENVIQRVIQGKYEPNLRMLLPKMIEILEAYLCDHEWSKWFIPWVDAKKEIRFCQLCKLSEERPLDKEGEKVKDVLKGGANNSTF